MWRLKTIICTRNSHAQFLVGYEIRKNRASSWGRAASVWNTPFFCTDLHCSEEPSSTTLTSRLGPDKICTTPILKNQSPKYSEELRLLPKMEADFFVHLFVTQNTYRFSANSQKMFIGFCGTSECLKSLFELTLRGPWIRNTTLGFNDHYTFYHSLCYMMCLSKMANKFSENHNFRNVKWHVS